MSGLRPPEPLRHDHVFDLFANGRHPSLDEWLRIRAAASEGRSARTYVATLAAEPLRVVGYHCIAAAKVERAAMPSARLRQGLPDDVPLLLIGRLAVDKTQQGRGLGSALLVDAVRRCVAASVIVGARAVAAHAIDDEAVAFYRKHGFVEAPTARFMVLPIETARALVDRG